MLIRRRFQILDDDLNIVSVLIAFEVSGTVDGTSAGVASGSILTINFDTTSSSTCPAYVPAAYTSGTILDDYSYLDDLFGGEDFFSVIEETDQPSGLVIL